ncbi:MAG TPA: hypothetical protein VHD55_03650 [Candidatus Paceibacterota bacterium]|nr:hypothetical protein [Candidatus Paceibacterota bacterium]
MKPNFILLCDSAEISENDKKLNIRGVFDSINVPGFPAIHSSMCIVVNIEIPADQQNKQYMESFRISCEGKEIGRDSTTFEPKNFRHQFIHRLQGFPVEKEGRYDVEILIGEKTVASSYFTVKKI